jgi:hypothetical protein
MNFEQFKKKYRCSISRKLQLIGHRQMRNIEVKTFIIYVDIRTMLPFNPQTDEDCLNCISFSSDSSENAKLKAYNFIKEKI